MIQNIKLAYRYLLDVKDKVQKSENYGQIRKYLRYIVILLLITFVKKRIYDKMKPITSVLGEMYSKSYRKVILGNMLVISIYN